MLKIITVVTLGLLCAGCTLPSLSDLPQGEPGSLIVVCPGGEVILKQNGKNCFDFMQTENDS